MIGASTKSQWAKQRKATLLDVGQWLEALDPSSIEIDDRTAQESLSFSASYAKLINFYDLHNRQNTNWSGFLLKDPTILMAVISKTEFRGQHEQYLQLRQRLSFLSAIKQQELPPRRLMLACENINQIFNLTINLFVEINSWLVSFNSDHHRYPLKDFVYKKTINELAPVLEQTLQLQILLATEYGVIDEPNYYLVNGFVDQLKGSSAIKTDERSGKANLNSIESQQTPLVNANKLIVAHKELCELYQQVFSFFVQVIDRAKVEYTHLANKGNGYPDTSLLIAFSKLLQIHRQQLNGITEKHLDFYYHTILKQTLGEASPDELYLSLGLAQKSDSLNIPAGTEFVGNSKIGGFPVAFASTKDHDINKIKVEKARTLFYGTAPANNGQDGRHNLPLKKLYARQIVKPNTQAKNQQGEVLSWPLFGALGGNKEQLVSDKLSEPQQGFALASPVLYLQGGIREITISFTFTESIEIKPFKSCDVYLSSKSKWIKVVKPLFEQPSDATLTLKINLKATDLPVLPLTGKTPNSQSQWPLVKLLLSDEFDLSKPPSLTKVSIGTVVSKFDNIELYRGEKKLKNVGFLPFGPGAQHGEELNICGDELLAKQVNKLQLNVNWENLPANFETYYQQYNTYLKDYGSSDAEHSGSYFQNSVFTGKFAIQKLKTSSDTATDSDDQLSPLKDEKLFTPPLLDHPVEGSIQPHSSISSSISSSLSSFELLNGDRNKVTTAEPQWLSADRTPASKSMSPFIQIQLATPSNGFGTDLYPKVIAEVTYDNAQVIVNQARSGHSKGIPLGGLKGWALKKLSSLVKKAKAEIKHKSKGKKIRPLPNIPYIPKIRSLSIDYTADQVFDLTKAPTEEAYPFEFYHLGSFSEYQAYDANKVVASPNAGHLAPMPSSQSSPAAPLALYPGAIEGSLYMSLTGVDGPCTLSLFFELASSSATSEKADEMPSVGFSYLSHSGWKKMIVLSDSTSSFCQSGVIDVQIDDDITSASELMGDQTYWIAAFVENNANHFADVVSIDSQIVKARRIDLAHLAPGERVELAAGQIIRPKTPQPAIQSVKQLLASSGGKPAETKGEFYQRVSRRIRNKNRVCVSDDYVEAVLHRFPEVYFAICNKKADKPNNRSHSSLIQISLLRAYSSACDAGAFRPTSNALLLSEVQLFLQGKTSPYAQLSVRNMQHQVVTVTADLCFTTLSATPQSLKKINQQLRVYLSPWISSAQAQRSINGALTGAGITEFLLSLPEVEAVTKLSISFSGKSDAELLVSADQHCLVSCKRSENSPSQGGRQ